MGFHLAVCRFGSYPLRVVPPGCDFRLPASGSHRYSKFVVCVYRVCTSFQNKLKRENSLLPGAGFVRVPMVRVGVRVRARFGNYIFVYHYLMFIFSVFLLLCGT